MGACRSIFYAISTGVRQFKLQESQLTLASLTNNFLLPLEVLPKIPKSIYILFKFVQ